MGLEYGPQQNGVTTYVSGDIKIFEMLCSLHGFPPFAARLGSYIFCAR